MPSIVLPYWLLYLLLVIALGALIFAGIQVYRKDFHRGLFADMVALLAVMLVGMSMQAQDISLLENSAGHFFVAALISTILMTIAMIFLIVILIRYLNGKNQQED
ncbi:hypothetical protein [Enterococcus nangangensis]|uniref:hypothetical protein n=1 Tax=Enterococcus nangangensis TaxID=2559926 RepID=UPI0010F8DC9C|nr:hypothetical protein [Enterococcus nangangensis]